MSNLHIARRLLVTLLLLCPAIVQAHKESASYLSLNVTRSIVTGQWDIALRDLDYVIGLDANADGAITWGEVRAQGRAIGTYALSRLHLTTRIEDGESMCPTRMQELLVDRHVDGAYAVLRFQADCHAAIRQLSVNYDLLFAVDPNHRGRVNVRTRDFNQTLTLSASAPSITLNATKHDVGLQLRSFVNEGVWHIWQGYDHLLFLFTLLLPAVLTYQAGVCEARPTWRDSTRDILKVVTAFTAAHSVTLSLAALDFVRLPTRIVETTIAFTVLLGALNLIYPVVRERRWLVALLFGLIHGLGFASVLADLHVPARGLLLSLVSFNIGVELGQLAVVAALMPLIYCVRETFLYRRLLLPAGAATMSCIAVYWIGIRLSS